MKKYHIMSAFKKPDRYIKLLKSKVSFYEKIQKSTLGSMAEMLSSLIGKKAVNFTGADYKDRSESGFNTGITLNREPKPEFNFTGNLEDGNDLKAGSCVLLSAKVVVRHETIGLPIEYELQINRIYLGRAENADELLSNLCEGEEVSAESNEDEEIEENR